MLSEKIELLGKGLYKDIPDVITLQAIPTASELEYVGSEDFDKIMIENILPEAIEENIDCYELLDIDYNWILRCLRILNYGPYYTTNAIYCNKCGVSYGEYNVDLTTIDCKPLPANFSRGVVISKDEFIDFDGDIKITLPTIKQVLTAYNDKAFQKFNGKIDRELARICYMITSIGNSTNINPVEVKMTLKQKLCAADYRILKNLIGQKCDFGLRAGGTTICPTCRKDATFLALIDDRFFRPTLGDLRRWRDDRSSGGSKNIPADTTKAV